MSWPSSNARRSERATRGNASRQIASVKGLAFAETYGSINCVSASIPVDAVNAGGSASVSSGSTTASAGSISGLRRLTFWWLSGTVKTAFRVTSAPVPAVVGTAMNGRDRAAIVSPRPTTSR